MARRPRCWEGGRVVVFAQMGILIKLCVGLGVCGFLIELGFASRNRVFTTWCTVWLETVIDSQYLSSVDRTQSLRVSSLAAQSLSAFKFFSFPLRTTTVHFSRLPQFPLPCRNSDYHQQIKRSVYDLVRCGYLRRVARWSA